MNPRNGVLMVLIWCWASPLEAQSEFVRGDCNNDGVVSIADASWIITLGIWDGQQPTCFDACDVNDSDDLSWISDAVYLLSYLFGSGPVPPPPFTGCGVDPTPGPLSCISHDCSPPPVPQNPDYVLRIPSVTAGSSEEFFLRLLFDHTGNDVNGWSAGVCHDSGALSIGEVVPGTTTANLNNGSGPDYQLLNFTADGWTMAVLINFFGLDVLSPGTDYDLAVATYQAVGEPETSTEVSPCDTLGAPPVLTAIVYWTRFTEIPVKEPATVEIVQGFLRGDANADGEFQGLADAIYLLNHGFTGGPPPPCRVAADFNDSGAVEPLADAIGMLWYAFANGPPPLPPGLSCGHDPTEDDLDCLLYEGCP